ncbi:MAG: hypothetical protein ACM3KF_03320 [Acidobacteriota bacterium]
MANRLRQGIERGAAVFIAGTVMALGTTACAAPAEKPPATATAPADPSPSEGNPVETPKAVTLETPKEQIDPLTAKEALNIPDELDGDSLAEASHEGPDAIYEKFREFMKFQDPDGMSDKEFAQKVYEKINRANNAFFMMHLSDKWGDKNGNNLPSEVRQQCTDARNGLYGYPKNGTMTKESQIACEQRQNRAWADKRWEVTGGSSSKPYKEGGIYDNAGIKVISRSGDTVRFTVDKRVIMIIDNEVLRQAGLIKWDGSEKVDDIDEDLTETYEVTIKNGKITFKIVKDKQ